MANVVGIDFIMICESVPSYSSIQCKIQKNRCTVTVTTTIEHHGGHSRTPVNQRWGQVPGRSQTESRLWFYAYKKHKNGNYARRTSTQRHIRPSIYYGRSDEFSSGIYGKLPKISTLNVIFSRTADRIAAKFCITIKPIKPTSALTASTNNITYGN